MRRLRTARILRRYAIAAAPLALGASGAAARADVVTTIERRVADGNDDAEQRTDDTIYLGSSDLELAVDGSDTDMVGMRFANLTVPPGATITSAYIQFEADETNAAAASLTLHGQDADDAAPFTATTSDISNRTTTTASVAWSPPAWNTIDAAGIDERTPNLASIVQEIVDRSGWQSGNAMVIIVTGTGTRTAEAYEGEPAAAALLHIEYTGVVESRIAAAADDAEEESDGTMYLGSSDLELAVDSDVGHPTERVGLRFTGIGVPVGATITAATVQFTTDEVSTGTTALTLRGAAADTPAAFTSTNGDISGRTSTTASVAWAPPDWNSVGEAGVDQRTPNLSAIIQEIVDRPGWAQGNPVVLTVTGTGTRVAESFEGAPAAAPLLRIEYTMPTTVGPATSGACGGSDCSYQSIQAAINAASAGDTIVVYRRTDDAANNACYNEHLTVDKADVTLMGASSAPANVACIAPSTGGNIVTVTASGVTLQNLHISGKANDGAAGENAKGAGGRASGHGILVSGADIVAHVLNCTVDFTAEDNIRFDGDTDQDGVGYITIKQCYLHHSDTNRNIRIHGGGGDGSNRHVVRNNLIHTGHGILVTGEAGHVTIDKNVIRGWPYWSHLGGSFPELRGTGFGGGWRYYSNCVTGVWVTSASPAGLVVHNNLIVATRIGVRVTTDGSIRNNTIVNPFNAAQYDFDGTILGSDVRDNTYGIMVVDGFGGTIQNNIVVVTEDNRATGAAGRATSPYYTPGITGYGVAFYGNAGTPNGASVTHNNVWGFVDTDGATPTNYGSGITQDSTNLSVDPQFATDTADESNGGSGPCLADGQEVGDTRCHDLYIDNYFLSTTREGGGCHANVLANTAGAAEYVDLSAGGSRDPDTHDLSGLGDCSGGSDAIDSRAVDFGTGGVGSEPTGNGGQVNLGAFGGTARASLSPTLRLMAIDVGDGGVRDGDTADTGVGLVQPRSAGITELNLYFNRSLTATSSSFKIRDLCDTVDLTAPTVDTSAAAVPPYRVTLTWSNGTFSDEAVRVHVLGDGADRIVDNDSAAAFDGEISHLVGGTLPSGNATAGGDAQFVVFALAGDVDGDQRVEGAAGEDDHAAVTGFAGYPGASCAACPQDLDADGDVDAADLAIVTAGSSEMVRETAAVSFTNISTGSGLNTTALHSMVFADFNNDGFIDMAKTHTSTSGARTISINDGDRTFTTSTTALPIGYRGLGWGDYDNDGDIDLVGRDPNNSGSPEILRNDGAADGLSWTAFLQSGNNNESTMFADIDGDGDLDVWNIGDNDVWHRNDGTTTFAAVDAMPGLANDDMPNGEGGTAADFTGDGYPDFMWNDANGSGSTQAWTNDADFTYTNHENVTTDFGLPEAVGDHENMEWAWGDYDNDGDLDVFISGSAGVGLYDNDGSGSFTNVSTASGVTIAATTNGADWGDYDNDGDLDLIVAKSTSTVLYENDGDGTFTDVTGSVGITTLGNVVGWIDVDNDGDLDLMSGEGELLENDLGDCHFLRVMVTGSGSGSSAVTPIGAHITVFQAGTSNLVGFREIAAGYNNFQPPPIQHFGLDPTAQYDVVVFFPASGTTTTLSAIRPDQETRTIGATTLENTVEVTEGWTTLLADDFDRADSTTLGNGWSEIDATGGAEARVLSNTLAFEASNETNEPLISNTFAKRSTGEVKWTFTFNMERTGSENTYEVRLQLGDSAVLVSPTTSDNTGVAVNLMWASPDQGLTNHEGFGVDDSGSVTEIGVVSGDAGTNSGGDATVVVIADLDANTFDVTLSGIGLISGSGSITAAPFDNNVDIDTVRIYFDALGDGNFGDLEIDDLLIEHRP